MVPAYRKQSRQHASRALSQSARRRSADAEHSLSLFQRAGSDHPRVRCHRYRFASATRVRREPLEATRPG